MPRRRGYDPTRRNRNIGTSKQGRGRDNWMDIPWPDDRRFFERLVRPVLVHREINEETWSFVIEPTLRDHLHTCTLDDIQRVLELFPPEDLEGIRTIVLRQPTRKQEMYYSAWGRWCLTEQLGPHDGKWLAPTGPFRCRHGWGPAILIEAQSTNRVTRWPTRISPDGARELERLRDDGHRITEEKRHHVIQGTLETYRATQLYRTLPHELGHHVDYWRTVVKPSEGKGEAAWRRLDERYWNTPECDREAFAHRYADTFRRRMFQSGHFPFERLVDPSRIVRDGLEVRWFAGGSEGVTVPPIGIEGREDVQERRPRQQGLRGWITQLWRSWRSSDPAP